MVNIQLFDDFSIGLFICDDLLLLGLKAMQDI